MDHTGEITVTTPSLGRVFVRTQVSSLKKAVVRAAGEGTPARRQQGSNQPPAIRRPAPPPPRPLEALQFKPLLNGPGQRSGENSGKHFSDLTAGVILVCGVDDHMIGYLTLVV